ncbi:MBL fold metallo-hydrolase [Nocardia nova]|uniref:MBL fold metallo-hydrolase n=1 Tax=Nocardia nova TaxID=37330 RepID=UPI0033F66ED5
MLMGFLGHNGFACGTQEHPVLLDPILLPRYGEEYTSSPVEIYPPRTIRTDRLPTPAAVVISHEHSDHFHVTSLNKLSRSTEVIVGPLMIDSVTENIAELGFSVRRAEFGEDIEIGSTVITLYPARPDTVLWESRVSQVYVRDAADPDVAGIYLSIDALVSEEFLADIDSGRVPPPAVLALSNNAQITPPGVFGSLDNLKSAELSEGSGQRTAFAGLDIGYELLVHFADAPQLRDCHFLICGGGFLKDYEAMGPFPFSEQRELAEALSMLVRNVDVYGPEPGELLDCGPEGIRNVGELDWIGVDARRFAELKQRRDQFLGDDGRISLRPICIPADGDAEETDIAAVSAGLEYLSRGILISDLGRRLVGIGRERTGLGAHRLIVKLLTHHVPARSFAWHVRTGAFEEIPDPTLEDALATFPFGLVVHASDLAAVFTGELQIWDIVGIAMRSWYAGDSLNSPVALMFNLYGEQIRPDISCRVYRKQLQIIGEGVE